MKKNYHVLMLFIDGVGIGENDEVKNPFFKYNFSPFKKYFQFTPSLEAQAYEGKNKFIFPIDACMGVDGLPQSGTGQTSIFCGVNAPKIIGKHFGPFPYSTLHPVIRKKNLFKTFRDKSKKVFFANAYPQIFFDYISEGKRRLSVTTLSCVLSNIPLNSSTKVWQGKAITAEIINDRWNERLGYNLPKISAKTAARRLLKFTQENDLTIYEYFLTDHLGHGRNSELFEKIFFTFDEFLFTILNELNTDNTTLLICSDHGNFEDLSIKTHTINPALGISVGLHSKHLFEKIKDLSQIKSSLEEIL